MAAYMGDRAEFIVGANTNSREETMELMQVTSHVGASASLLSPHLFQDQPDVLIDCLLSKTIVTIKSSDYILPLIVLWLRKHLYI